QCLDLLFICFFFSSRRRHTRLQGDWSSDVCSSDLHDLDRQQNRDQVAADEHARRADRKQHRGEHEIVIERHHQGSSRRASTTAPTIATRISTDVTSKGKAYVVNSDRPIAATELTEPPANVPDSPAFVNAHSSSTTTTIA